MGAGVRGMKSGPIDSIVQRLKNGKKTRFVAFGSSNTEMRAGCRLNWLDWLDLGIRHTYGRVHHTINAGINGDNSRGLVARFDEDVLHYDPHVVFITIGGNDSSPDPARHVASDEFRGNLLVLVERMRQRSDAIAVFQTYYSPDVEALEQQHAADFLVLMDVVREVAGDTGSVLIDHLARWEPLRQTRPDEYSQLMQDAFHVNALGNMVLGLDLIRCFDAALADHAQVVCAAGIAMQSIFDELIYDGER